MINYDEIDKKIIEILQSDGTLSYRELAAQIGVSDATIRRRFSRLVEDEVFKVVAVANPYKLGYSVMAIIGLQVDMLHIARVEMELVNLPEVRFLGLVLGHYDLILEAWFHTNDDLLEFVTITLGRIEGVRHSESFQIMRLSKYTYGWGKIKAGGDRSQTGSLPIPT